MQPADIVEQAWTATLPGVPFDRAQSWADAGGDSLKMLTLVLHLERLGQLNFPYDRLHSEVTPADLVIILQTLSDPVSAPASTSTPTATLHVVPGVLGGTLKIMQFARQFADRLRLEIAPAPDLASSARTLLSVERTANYIARDIGNRQPEGPLHLAGYCFGGVLAFEAARQLQARGREVASVAVIDGLLASPAFAAAAADPARAREAARAQGLMTQDLRTWYGYGGAPGWKRALLNFAFRRRWYRLLRFLARLVLQRRQSGHWLSEALLHRLRGIAWTQYRPATAPLALHVFATEEMRLAAGEDLGWGPWCSSLASWPLDGTHMDVFETDPDSGLAGRLIDHVSSAGH